VLGVPGQTLPRAAAGLPNSGALEWAILTVLLVLFVVITRAARVEWRRMRAATVPPR
jgi:hypothetical protein